MTPVLNDIDRIENALVNVFQGRFGKEVYRVDGTWFFVLRGEDYWENKTINLSAIARDLERALSC